MIIENVTAELRDRSDRSGVQFVLTDLEVALSYLNIADQTRDVERQRRLCAGARKAHQTILHFISRFTFSASEAAIVDRKLRQIRDRIQNRGF